MNPAAFDGMPNDVLIVEDDPLIALDFEDRILGFGVKSVRATGSVAGALALIDKQAPDFALLDVALVREKSFAIAERLEALKIPFVFITGYGSEVRLPPAFANKPLLPKPCPSDALEAVMRQRAPEPIAPRVVLFLRADAELGEIGFDAVEEDAGPCFRQIFDLRRRTARDKGLLRQILNFFSAGDLLAARNLSSFSSVASVGFIFISASFAVSIGETGRQLDPLDQQVAIELFESHIRRHSPAGSAVRARGCASRPRRCAAASTRRWR